MGRLAYRVVLLLKYVSCFLISLFFLLAFTPTVFYMYPELPKYFLFDTKASRNNYNPSTYSFNGYNMYLPSQTSMIPIWILIPKSWTSESLADAVAELSTSDTPIIFYVHGNSYDRADEKRIAVYKNMTNAGYPVITFDYRGFGENSGDTSGYSAVEDTKIVYRWLESVTAGNKVFWWSHSFGCAVAARAARDLLSEHRVVDALVVESPFQSTRTMIQGTKMYRMTIGLIPSFISELIMQSLFDIYGIDFEVDVDMGNLKNTSILHLHAKDDHVINVKHAEAIKEYMTKISTKYYPIVFNACRKYNHYIAYLAHETVPLLDGFVQKVTEQVQKPTATTNGIAVLYQ